MGQTLLVVRFEEGEGGVGLRMKQLGVGCACVGLVVLLCWLFEGVQKESF